MQTNIQKQTDRETYVALIEVFHDHLVRPADPVPHIIDNSEPATPRSTEGLTWSLAPCVPSPLGVAVLDGARSLICMGQLQGASVSGDRHRDSVRPSIRRSVRPSVCPSIRPSVSPSIRPHLYARPRTFVRICSSESVRSSASAIRASLSGRSLFRSPPVCPPASVVKPTGRLFVRPSVPPCVRSSRPSDRLCACFRPFARPSVRL